MSENVNVSNCSKGSGKVSKAELKAQLLAQLAKLELEEEEISNEAMIAKHPVGETSKLAMVNIESGKEGVTSSSDIGAVSATIADIPKGQNFLQGEVRISHTQENQLRTSDNDSWAIVIDDFLEATCNSKLTRKSYRKHVNAFKTFVKGVNQPKQLKKEHYKAYADSIENSEYAQNTIRSYLIPICSFGSFIQRRYEYQYDASDIIKLDKKVRTKKDIVDQDDIETLLDMATSKKQEFLAFLYFGALRLMECCKIKYKDLSLVELECNEMEKKFQSKQRPIKRSGKIYYKPPLQEYELHVSIIGKGNRKRTVRIGARGMVYLKHLAMVDEKKKEQYVFTGRDGISAIGHRTAQKWVKDLCTKLNIMIDEFTGKSKVTPHMLRHTAASHAMHKGADLMTVSEFLGHASVQTTEIYLHPDKKKSASSFL